ncbi:MAG: hypothetical protein LUC98_01255 [Lachnospiraceae bacterium]|nr:hypothetical protein [Lachnospiraceae bacterium]
MEKERIKKLASVILYTILTIALATLIGKYPATAVLLPLLLFYEIACLALYGYKRKRKIERETPTASLLADGFPYLSEMWGNPYFLAFAQLENVEVRVYNRILLWKPWRFMGRLHDKYLIVDNLGYILGGRNTYDYFLGATDGKQNYDWDVLVYTELAGEDSSLQQVLDYFYSVWDLPVCRTLAEQYPDWLNAPDYEEMTVAVNHIELLSNPTNIYAKEPTAFYAITELMLEAQESVVFHTPYIICDDWMLVIDGEELNRQLQEEMQYYEDDSLKVVDAETSIAPDGKEMQKISDGKRVLLQIMRLLLWGRFVM